MHFGHLQFMDIPSWLQGIKSTRLCTICLSPQRVGVEIWISHTIVHHESSIPLIYVCLLTTKLFPTSMTPLASACCVLFCMFCLHLHSCLIIVVVRTLLLAISTAVWIQIARRPNGKKGCDIGGAKEPGVIYFPTNWGAKEPQNLPNHRVGNLTPEITGFHLILSSFQVLSPCWHRRVNSL